MRALVHVQFCNDSRFIRSAQAAYFFDAFVGSFSRHLTGEKLHAEWADVVWAVDINVALRARREQRQRYVRLYRSSMDPLNRGRWLIGPPPLGLVCVIAGRRMQGSSGWQV